MYKDAANQKSVKYPLAMIEYIEEDNTLYLSGTWVWSTINEARLKELARSIKNHIPQITIDGSKIISIDTIGAYFINKIINHLKYKQTTILSFTIPKSERKFFTQIEETINDKPIVTPKVTKSFIDSLGQSTFLFFQATLSFISFFGQFIINLLQFVKSPFQLNWAEVARTINDSGFKGVWVASLLSFLIGITLAYQMSPQFITYGANVYVVNFLGIALLKEVSPLLTAIIVAGRTGAAITAEIGTMKVQEEIDAIQTMGISPIRRLVLPKVLGAIIAVPLITSIADIASLAGGAIVANSTLDVTYTLFLERLQTYVSINNYTCGIIKSFAFAILIALVGCFCGFNVRGNANSIGEQTTKSVVLSIILIVFIDAVFAVIFKILQV